MATQKHGRSQGGLKKRSDKSETDADRVPQSGPFAENWADFINKVSFLLLYITIVGIPLFYSWNTKSNFIMPKTWAYEPAIALVTLFWGISIILNKKVSLFRSGVYFPAAFYLAICALSVEAGRVPYEGDKALRVMVVAAFGGFLVGNLCGTKLRVRAILWGMVIVACLESVWGVTQRLKHDPILHLTIDTVGTFGNSNYLGAFLGLITPVVLALSLAEYYGEKDPTKKRFIIAALLVAFLALSVGLLMTLCQGADLSTGLAILGIAVIWLITSKGKARAIAMTVVGATMGLLVAAVLVASLLGQMPLKKIAYLGERAVGGRILMWEASMKMVGDHPILGIGIGNFQINYLDYLALTLKNKDMIKIKNIIQNEEKPHNAYVQIWSETGSLGLAGFLATLAIFFWGRLRIFFKIKHPAEFWTHIAIVAGFFGFCALLFVSSLMVIAPFREYFWIFMGLAIAWERAIGTPEKQDAVVEFSTGPGRRKWLVFIVAVCVPAIWLIMSCERSSRHWKADVLWQQGINVTHSGNIKESIALYDEALKLIPHDMKLLFYRGSAVIKLSEQEKDSEKKRALLEEGVNNLLRAREGYGDVNLDSNLAKAYSDLGQHDESVKYYRFAADTGLKIDYAYTNLGVELMLAGKPEEARAAFEKALKADPNSARAGFNLGLALLNLHHADLAEKQFRELADYLQNNPEVFTNLGLALMEQNKVTEAIESFRNAVETDATNIKSRNNLAAALWKIGKKEEALEQWRQVLRIDPENPVALENLQKKTNENPVPRNPYR